MTTLQAGVRLVSRHSRRNQLLEADAGAEGVIAPPGALLLPIEPLAGASDEPMDGEVDGDVDGVVEGEVDGVMGAGVVVSSTFLPQAPSASNADRLTATRATGFRVDAFIGFPFKNFSKIQEPDLKRANTSGADTSTDESTIYKFMRRKAMGNVRDAL